MPPTLQPGLERIARLVHDLSFPWSAVHVAGTNGKGSICHYAASFLARKSIPCGKFTSPHLVDRWDCIAINNRPVEPHVFRKAEAHYLQRNARLQINASPFEILTATAFHLFTEQQVQVALVEVGMGGALDATNILQNQCVSVIAKIARDHENFLGTTLDAIALHKAGILRPNIPYLVHPANELNVQAVIDQYARDIGAGPRIALDSPEMHHLRRNPGWPHFATRLPPFQRANAALAIFAAQEAARSAGVPLWLRQIKDMLRFLSPPTVPGRAELVSVPPVFGQGPRRILVDGAHNPDAALALNELLSARERRKAIDGKTPPDHGWPITWVLAMTEGKDALQFLRHILKPGDNVITTSFGPVDGMPWVKSIDPKRLLEMAQSATAKISGLHMTQPGPLRALCAAKHLTEGNQPIVLTGSLYFVGDFHRELRTSADASYGTEQSTGKQRITMYDDMLEEERVRVNLMLSATDDSSACGSSTRTFFTAEQKQRINEREKMLKLREQIQSLDEELEHLSKEEFSIQQPLGKLDRSSSLGPVAAQPTPTPGDQDQGLGMTIVPLKKTPHYLRTLDAIRAKLQILQELTNTASPLHFDTTASRSQENEVMTGKKGGE